MSTLNNSLAVVVPFYNEQAVLPGTLNALYGQQGRSNTRFILVDNGSTDDSRGAIARFLKDHSDFPAHVIDEQEKGTGCASDTGFKEAIARGHAFIARTDADTHPRADWTQNIRHRFLSRPDLQLLGGITNALRDEHALWCDSLVGRSFLAFGRVALSVAARSPWPLRTPIGHNLATRAQAYTAVGGFPRTAIDAIDEDKVYAHRIYKQYGFAAMGIARDVVVRTSARRLRAVGGYAGMYAYYFGTPTTNHSDYRNRVLNGNIDVR